MTQWNYKVNLQHIFHSPDLTIHSKAGRIAEAFRLRLGRQRIWNDEIEGLLEELADQTDADDFDDVWNAIYDWCDENRVWVMTRPFLPVLSAVMPS